MTPQFESAFDALLSERGVVLLVGGLDSGKTTFALELLRRATQSGVRAALVDSDIVQSTVGPPTTVGLKLCDGDLGAPEDWVRTADGLSFVGSLVPKGHLLPLVTGTAKLVARARRAECDLVVVDTTSLVSGIYGQTLKYFKMDLVEPDVVVAFERGGELEPIVGLAQRFTRARVIELDVSSDVVARSVEERMTARERRFAAYFGDDASRWRIKPTVFMPTLPPEFDCALLDGLVVGMEDGGGSCVGIGVIEYEPAGDVLRMVSPVSEGVRGLRLGSLRIDTTGRSKGPVDLRQLFGSE